MLWYWGLLQKKLKGTCTCRYYGRCSLQINHPRCSSLGKYTYVCWSRRDLYLEILATVKIKIMHIYQCEIQLVGSYCRTSALVRI